MRMVSILGCGWLGLSLAESLISAGFTVKGSTTTPRKSAIFTQTGLQPFVITLDENGIKGDISSFLQQSEILIIMIPPGLRKEKNGSFANKIKLIIPAIEKSGTGKVIFVSSTSVYADENAVATEDTIPRPGTQSGIELLEAENLLQHNTYFKTTVVRFGGLIGEDRHPVYSLAGKTGLSNPHAPVNLIHCTDCIGIIRSIIEKEAWGETFNAVAPNHPTREEYYTLKAKEYGLPLPVFSNEAPSMGKAVASGKVVTRLGYTFLRNL